MKKKIRKKLKAKCEVEAVKKKTGIEDDAPALVAYAVEENHAFREDNPDDYYTGPYLRFYPANPYPYGYSRMIRVKERTSNLERDRTDPMVVALEEYFENALGRNLSVIKPENVREVASIPRWKIWFHRIKRFLNLMHRNTYDNR